VGNGCGQR